MQAQPTYIVLHMHMLKLCTLCELFETLKQIIRWHSTQLRCRLVTVIDASNFSCVLLIVEHPVCIRPIVDLLHLQARSSQESC